MIYFVLTRFQTEKGIFYLRKKYDIVNLIDDDDDEDDEDDDGVDGNDDDDDDDDDDDELET